MLSDMLPQPLKPCFTIVLVVTGACQRGVANSRGLTSTCKFAVVFVLSRTLVEPGIVTVATTGIAVRYTKRVTLAMLTLLSQLRHLPRCQIILREALSAKLTKLQGKEC